MTITLRKFWLFIFSVVGISKKLDANDVNFYPDGFDRIDEYETKLMR